MTEPKRVNLLWLFVIALFASVVIFDIAYGDEGHGHNHDNGDVIVDVVGGDLTGGDLIGGDNSIAGSRSYILSSSMGDVDINQCVISKQKSLIVIGWQNYDYNLWCMGESYDAKGLLYMAALMRCDIKEIRAHFTTDAACVEKNTTMVRVEPQPVMNVPDDDEEDHIEVLYALFSDLEAQRNEDVAKAKKAAQRANAAAHRANQAEIDRKAYAQQTLEAYREVINE